MKLAAATFYATLITIGIFFLLLAFFIVGLDN